MALDLKNPITKEQFESLTPYSKGYVAYMQGAWNQNVGEHCPYAEGTDERKEWNDGNQMAIIHTIDTEE